MNISLKKCVVRPVEARSSGQPTYLIFTEAGGAAIADVGPCDGDYEYAQLFAIAPQMAEALRKIEYIAWQAGGYSGTVAMRRILRIAHDVLPAAGDCAQ